MLSEMEKWQLSKMTVINDHGHPQPFKYVYEFVKNNQAMSAYDFKVTLNEIRDMMNQKSVNCGIMLYMHGTYVLTEVPVNFDPIEVKLSSGVNFNGEVSFTVHNLEEINKDLGR